MHRQTLFFDPPQAITSEAQIGIRLATEQDAENIAKVAIKTYVETYGDSTLEKAKNLYGANYVQETFPNLLRDEKNIFAIILHDNKIIGYAKLTIQDAGIALLDKLYLLKSHHRNGYGRSLLQFCYQKAYELGSTQGKLLVYDENISAIRFYEKNGFTLTGEKEYYLLPDGSLSNYLNLVMRAENIHNILKTETPILMKA